MKKEVAEKRHQRAFLPTTITTIIAAPTNDSRSKGPTPPLDSTVIPHFVLQPLSLMNHCPPLTRQLWKWIGSELNSWVCLKAALPTLLTLSLLVIVIAWTLTLDNQGMVIGRNRMMIVQYSYVFDLSESGYAYNETGHSSISSVCAYCCLCRGRTFDDIREKNHRQLQQQGTSNQEQQGIECVCVCVWVVA